MLGPIPVIPVIGGGPAGMSCALWLRNYALRPIIIEKERVLGGMAERSPYPNEGLLGRPNKTARENAKAFLAENPEIMVDISEKVKVTAGIGQTPPDEFSPSDDAPISLD